MSKYQFGCLKAEIGEMDNEGEVTWGKEIDIYQDTIVLNQPEAGRTPHYKQGDPNAKVVRYDRTERTISFSIMDLSAESKKEWLGGTATNVDGSEAWDAPDAAVNSTSKALRFTLEDGSVIIIANAECSARLESNLNDTDIAVIPVVATVKSTGVAGVSAFRWID